MAKNTLTMNKSNSQHFNDYGIRSPKPNLNETLSKSTFNLSWRTVVQNAMIPLRNSATNILIFIGSYSFTDT